MKFHLPDYEECVMAVEVGDATAVQTFVQNHEPCVGTEEFRNQLSDAIAEAIEDAGRKPRAVETDDNEMADVRAFHVKFNQLRATEPRHLTQRKLAERVNFMLEELIEFAEAAGLIGVIDGAGDQMTATFMPNEKDIDQDMELQADSLIDLVYVAKGTAVMLGLPWVPLWDDVQRANMAKVLGTTHRAAANPGQFLQDVCKPPGWVGPKTNEILVEHGYNVLEFMAPQSFTIDTAKCADDPQYKETK